MPRRVILVGSVVLIAAFGIWPVLKPLLTRQVAAEPIMAPCVLLGDSIAHSLGYVMPECVTYAASGIDSPGYVSRFTRSVRAASVAVLSLSTNDKPTLGQQETLSALREARRRVLAPRVIWLAPVSAGEERRLAVNQVAAENGDEVMDISGEVDAGKDGIHPAPPGYRRIALRLLP